MTDYYKDRLEKGLEYQDFVCDRLRQMNPARIILPYCSRKYQHEYGESGGGYEIKLDTRIRETGNIYIEVAEKSDPDNPEFVRSGIWRDDNTVYWLIGDYEEAFLFSKRQLQMICSSGREDYRQKNGIRRRETPTSIAYTFPLEFVRKGGYCLETFDFRK